MSDVLLALAVVAASMVVAALSLTALTVWLLCRRNRVHPRSRTGAPLVWLVSPVLGARTHRRLRGAVRLTTTHGPWSPALRDQVDELHEQAIRVDAHVVRLARLPRAERGRQLRQLTPRVVLVERTAVRLVGLARPTTVAPAGWAGDDLDDLAERIDLIDQARVELGAPGVDPPVTATSGEPWVAAHAPRGHRTPVSAR